MAKNRSVVILLAEDDDDDYLLMKQAFQKARIANELHRVRNGEELMELLLWRSGERHDSPPRSGPWPSLILLDLNMPKMDGRQALREIKAHPELCRIPVVVLTTSQQDEDVLRSYQAGANSYIRKPVTFEQLVEMVRTLEKYWFEIVELPASDSASLPASAPPTGN